MNPLLALAACFAERIKVNAITREIRDGRPFWVKRRTPASGLILAGADRFFRLAGNPVNTVPDLAEWQHWEVSSFLGLHGGEFQAYAEGPRTVVAEEMPGTSLARHLDQGTFTPQMAAAAARELRRAHACEVTGGIWSHGDSHSGNFLYDAASDRARLIDFEVMHDLGLSPEERHADDLLVFLQDVMGRVDSRAWVPVASAFVHGYGSPEITARLARRLVLPRGIPRLWWAIRTTYLPSAEVLVRLEALREALVG